MRTKPYTATLVMTPLMRAETWLGAAGWASGSHTCNGTRPALEPVPISTRTRTRPGRTVGGGSDLGEGVAAAAAGKQAECQQQRQRAEARHDDVDVAGAPVLGIAVVRHHQRPGRQRHELPGDQEGEGVVGQDDEVHAAEECRIEGQHAAGRRLVLAVADGKQAGAGAAEVQHHEKERGQRIHAEVRADPRQPDGKQHRRRGSRSRQQLGAGERPGWRGRSPGIRRRSERLTPGSRCRATPAAPAPSRTATPVSATATGMGPHLPPTAGALQLGSLGVACNAGAEARMLLHLPRVYGELMLRRSRITCDRRAFLASGSTRPIWSIMRN